MVKTIEEKFHAKISPSGSKRWMTCPGSVRLIDVLDMPYVPKRVTAEGTVGHEVHELSLVNNNNARAYIGRKFEADGFKFTVDENMTDAVQQSIDYIRGRVAWAKSKGWECEIRVEVWCSLKDLHLEGLDGGTSDVVLLFWEEDLDGEMILQMIEVVDYKHGVVEVEVENNTQALHYALGTILLPELKDHDIPEGIRITIAQPRLFFTDSVITSWEVTKDFVIDWMNNELIPKAKATQDENAEFNPSEDGCRWCEAKAKCKALNSHVLDVAMMDFNELGDLSLYDPESIEAGELAILMEHIPLIRGWLTSIEEQIKNEVDHGSVEYEGKFKMVRGKSNRKFLPDMLDEICSPLFDHLDHDDIFVQKERTMTEIEKRLKSALGTDQAGEIMEMVTEKPEGSLIIVPESDKRMAVQPSIISDFKDLD